MARVKLSFAFICAFDAHFYRAGSGSEAVPGSVRMAGIGANADAMAATGT